MIPNLLGLIAMILVSRHSDRALERRHHMAAAGAWLELELFSPWEFRLDNDRPPGVDITPVPIALEPGKAL